MLYTCLYCSHQTTTRLPSSTSNAMKKKETNNVSKILENRIKKTWRKNIISRIMRAQIYLCNDQPITVSDIINTGGEKQKKKNNNKCKEEREKREKERK